jgi:lipopolysaccharide transport system ATP-binding protein
MDARVWQIGIFGTFDVQNYGDLLFPLIAEVELKQRLGHVRIHPFSYHARSRPDWPYQVHSLTELPRLVTGLDGVLIGGGHIVRFDKDVAAGYRPPTPELHHPTSYWLTPALIALQAGLPTVWNSPSVQNEIPAWAEPLLGLALGSSSYIAVRDEDSRRAIARFAGEIALVPDTAFGVKRLLAVHEQVNSLKRWIASLAGPYVIVQATTGLEAFTRLARHHPEAMSNRQVVVVPIGPVNQDRDEIITASLPEGIRLPYWPDPASMAALISRADGVIGPSLHLAITALALGVAVFRPAHAFEGKYSLLNEFDSIVRFDSQGEIDPREFAARLGRSQATHPVRLALERLSAHWDRVAQALTAGRAPVPAAYLRFWQNVPILLENLTNPSRTHSDAA